MGFGIYALQFGIYSLFQTVQLRCKSSSPAIIIIIIIHWQMLRACSLGGSSFLHEMTSWPPS